MLHNWIGSTADQDQCELCGVWNDIDTPDVLPDCPGPVVIRPHVFTAGPDQVAECGSCSQYADEDTLVDQPAAWWECAE